MILFIHDFQIWKTNDKYRKLLCIDMHELSVRLGCCIIRDDDSHVIGLVNRNFLLDVINKFGISREDLGKIKFSYYDLLEIYTELKHFGFSTKYHLRHKTSSK